MFKFLFGKSADKAEIETQRDTVKRNLEELNGVLALMADKPVVGVDLNTGMITIDLPEQMPDEALALPAPAKDAKPDPVAPAAKADETPEVADAEAKTAA